MDSPRLLVFVVAYNAARTLADVLDRIPKSLDRYRPRVLVIDDSSEDATFEVGREWVAEHPERDVEVLVTPTNQGYGGNQKIGYRYAIHEGFDAVALLHGDGQYAPEVLPELTAPVLAGEADLVMGTRMGSPRAALAGGMPLYKLVGNRVLSWFQNRVLGVRLSEFHSGYRVYRVAALAQVPFELNTDDFHFDTEIIIQFLRRGLRIAERPIPVYYGDEICHVNGLAYAANVVRATIASRLHDLGVFYRPNFEVRPPEQLYELKLGYPSSHTFAIAAVPEGARVLDVGCGRGRLAAELAARGCRVHGVEEADLGEPVGLSRFDRVDLDRAEIPLWQDGYDCVLLLDILEHLDGPERALEWLREHLGASRPLVVVSVPNVAFLAVRLRLLLGGFEYGREGILDLTHKRLFTFRSLRRMLSLAGYEIERVRGVPAPFPKAFGVRWWSRLLVTLNHGLIRLLPGLFSYQIFVTARPRPTVSHLLQRTREASRLRRRNDPPKG